MDLEIMAETWDIEVEEDHCFFAEGILVHNSAELAKGKVTDKTFINLKDYKIFPEREAFGWLSNNSVELITDEDFESLGEIAERVKNNGEPGYINIQNLPYARIGKKMKGLRYDKATGLNPCGEIPLEALPGGGELCNVVETLPTMCRSTEQWYQACRYATFYSSTVSLLPTHQPNTNKIIARNRRIGVSIIDFSGWKMIHGVHKITTWLRRGYKIIREENKNWNDEAGIPVAIRVTTIKPGGTSPKLPGRTPGIGHPTFDYTIRRVMVSKTSPVHELLVAAGVPYEQALYDKYTDVFEWPILQGPAVPADKVSLWEQAMNLVLVQREWADNAVSNTLYFRPKWPLIQSILTDFENQLTEYLGTVTACQLIMGEQVEYIVPDRYKIKLIRLPDGEIKEIKVYEYDPLHEEDYIEPVLSSIAPVTKSVSLLPHSPKGAYPQMPEEGCSEEEYYLRLSQIDKIDWSRLSGSDGKDEKYCGGPSCEIR